MCGVAVRRLRVRASESLQHGLEEEDQGDKADHEDHLRKQKLSAKKVFFAEAIDLSAVYAIKWLFSLIKLTQRHSEDYAPTYLILYYLLFLPWSIKVLAKEIRVIK